MTSPGGKPVAQVSVRVVPDLGGFDEKLRRELANLPDAVVNVQFDLDREQLRRELDTLQGITVTIPVNFDVENARDDIARATAGAKADPVKVPVEVDKDALDQQIHDLDNLPPINQPVDVDPTQAAAEAKQAADAAQAAADANPVNIPTNVDRDELRKQLNAASVDPILVPAKIDADALRRQLADARSAAEIAGRDPVLFKLDADETVLRRKIAQVEADLAQLREHGGAMQIDLNTAPVLAKITRVEAEIERLSQLDASPKVEIQTDKAILELHTLNEELNRLRNVDVKPAVEIALQDAEAQLARLIAELSAIDGRRVKVVAEMDVDTLRAEAKISAFVAREAVKQKINLNVDVDRNRFSSVLAGLANSIGQALSGGTLLNAGGLIGSIGSKLSGLSSIADGISSHFEGMGEALAGPLGVATQLSQVVLQIGAYAALAAVGGAAITAAYGAVATAIAAIPGLLGFVAAAGATVFLGLNGIKKAANAIKPAFTDLKKSVSDTFEKGLTPVFTHLATIFPKIKDSINNVAGALVNSAFSFTQFLTSSRGVATLNTIFNNTATALRNMQPGLDAIVQTFLTLASQAGVFDALTSAVNTFGAAFKKDVTDQLRDHTLTRAFDGLKGLLDQLSIGFADLVKNGISVFAAAAPGVTSFFKDLTGFFDRFNWDKLGKAVGNVFSGLGESLRNVPQSTIDKIGEAFGRLGELFKDPKFQADITNIINNLPAAIDQIKELTQAFADIGSGIATALGWLDKVDLKFKAFIDWWNKLSFSENGKGILTSSAQWWQDLMDLWDGWIKKLQDTWDRFAKWWKDHTVGALAPQQSSVGGSGGNPFGGFFDNFSLPDLPSFGDIAAPKLGPDWSRLGGDVQSTFDAMVAAARTGVRNLLDVSTAGMNSVRLALNFSGVGSSIGQAFLAMVGTVRMGMQSLANQVTDGMPLINAAFNFKSVGTSIGLAFLGMVGTVSLGMDSIVNTVLTKMPAVQAAFDFTNIGATLALTFQNLVTTTTLGMLSLANAVTTGMPFVNAAFNFASIGTTLGLAFLNMVGTVTLGMQSLAVAVTAGMPLVQAAFNFASIGTTLGLTFLGMVGTVNMGMQSLAAAVTAGMPLVQAAFNFSGISTTLGLVFLGMVGTVTLGMASIANAVIAGMAQIDAAFRSTWLGSVFATVSSAWALINGAVSSGLSLLTAAVRGANAQVVAAVQGANAQLVAIWRGGLAQIVGAAVSGMASFVGAIVSGAGRAVAAFVGLAAQALGVLRGMVGQAAAVGSAIISGLVGAISAGAGRVIGALQSLASRALASAKAALGIASPSKEFMKLGGFVAEGFALGMEQSTGTVAKSAAKMVNAATGAADQISSAFADQQWASDFNASVEHAFADIAPQTTNADVVGAIRRQSGDLDQSATLGSILAVLQAMYVQSRQGGSAVLTAQASRRAAELGAF